MVKEIAKAQTGILFNEEALRHSGIPDSCFPLTAMLSTPENGALDFIREKHDPTEHTYTNGHSKDAATSGSEPQNGSEKKDARDSTMPINDPLKQKPIWWLVEILPFPVSWQDVKGIWRRKWW